MIGRLHRQLLNLCGLLAGLGLTAIAVATSYDVIARNLVGQSTRGLLDLVEYGLYATTFLAAPWVLRENAHVQVDFVVGALAPRRRRVVEAIANLIGLVVSLVLLVYSIRVTYAAWAQKSMVLKAISFPEWWIYVVIPFASTLLVIEFVLRLWGRVPSHRTD